MTDTRKRRRRRAPRQPMDRERAETLLRRIIHGEQDWDYIGDVLNAFEEFVYERTVDDIRTYEIILRMLRERSEDGCIDIGDAAVEAFIRDALQRILAEQPKESKP